MSFNVLNESWDLKTIGDLVSANEADIQTGPFGTMLQAGSYATDGTPVIAVKDIGVNKIIHGNSPLINDVDAERLSRYKLLQGDIIFGRKGAVDRRALVTAKEEGWIQGSDCIRIRFTSTKIDPIFVSYFLGTRFYINWILSNAQGTTMPSLNQEILKRVPLPLPSIEEQRRIASVLQVIDQKIEINSAINKNLEEMAQALFKRWFLDFEFPSENGETYKSSGGEFEESELGLIPKGWQVIGLDEIIQINPKRTLKKGKAYPYVEMKNLTNNYARVIDLAIRDLSSGSKFKNGDVLLARITPCLENGKTAYVDFLENDQMGWGSTEFIVLRTIGNIPSEYAYFLARSEIFRTHAISNMTGSSGRQRVPDSSLKNFKIAFSCDLERIIDFGRVAKSALDLMKENDEESSRLKAIRDSLLPKLMSGEIRVPVKQYSRVLTTDLAMAAENKAQYFTS